MFIFLFSDIDVAVRKSKFLDSRLRRELYASGDTFEDAINSVAGKLPDETVDQLHAVRKMRNDVVHKEKNSLKSRGDFLYLCKEIEGTLNTMQRSWQLQNMGCVSLVIIFAATLIWLLS